MLKIVKIETSSLFPRPIENARVEVYPYPQNVYFVQDNRRIYLPTTVQTVHTNNYGNAEVQLIANDVLTPKPNFYVFVLFFNLKKYYFAAKITSDMDDIIYLKNILIYPDPNKISDCSISPNGVKILGEDVFI
jgi:hypothetical protein